MREPHPKQDKHEASFHSVLDMVNSLVDKQYLSIKCRYILLFFSGQILSNKNECYTCILNI